MSPKLTTPDHILAQYPLTRDRPQVTPLGNCGGFSGALLWRIETADGPLCLRRWPRAHPTSDHLKFMHQVLRFVRNGGFEIVPAPLPCRNGGTFIRDAGFLWELTAWLPGTADYLDRPSQTKLKNAVKELARFHCVADLFYAQPKHGPPPGIALRAQRLDELMSGQAMQIRQAVCAAVKSPLHDLGRHIMQRFYELLPRAEKAIHGQLHRTVRLLPCIRDIHAEHVLFKDVHVTGFVDFGALRDDTPAADVSRLLGSMAGSDTEAWRVGVEAYQAERKLSDDELNLVAAFDTVNDLIAGMNWLQWVFVDRRIFESEQRVTARVAQIAARLDCGQVHWP